jgi:hypothetical protein
MIKKLFGLFLTFAVFTVSAHAATNDGLKAAFDELNYKLTVEWDQKDKAFQQEQMKTFTATLRDLQAKGLTNSQLVDFVKSEVKNDRVAKDLETAFNMISINKMSAQEANKYVVETMKKSYSNGASWNGEVFIYIAAALLIVAVAIAIANADTIVVGGGSCYYQDYYVCDTYCYDDYYGYTCYDDCYWTYGCY